ncbi:hypothetical protein H312_03416 [Anncaliia algerae PRA339]|uniref:Uncharacterized protein n=1 Tax=Anncaliia algerae PRA339 TaxID=1288291 RepID=A0A059EWB2_9MICR|nr:hypothetical protein H312_03416 [Anncaliia algerae PRA339]
MLVGCIINPMEQKDPINLRVKEL